MGMTPSVTDLGEAELGRLHERLLAGDPVAPAELAGRLLPLLRARLAGWAATVDDPHIPGAEGKSPREIRRCVKRAIARQLFKLLQQLDRLDAEVVRVC
jgi:hypothetical protein